MKFLLDTHVLLWAAGEPNKLSSSTRALLNSPQNELVFSSASIWEIAIKNGIGRTDFQVQNRLLRQGLLSSGYSELPITGNHALTVELLPTLHRDPFDRILIAQAIAEGMTLLTDDAQIARYPAPVRLV